MDEISGGNVSAYIPDPELYGFVRGRATNLRMTVSAYLNLLLEIDRAQDVARKELLQRISAPAGEREAVPA